MKKHIILLFLLLNFCCNAKKKEHNCSLCKSQENNLKRDLESKKKLAEQYQKDIDELINKCFNSNAFQKSEWYFKTQDAFRTKI